MVIRGFGTIVLEVFADSLEDDGEVLPFSAIRL
jgi:hypothetical protein